MKSLFAADAFAGFGPTHQHPADYDPACGQVRHRRAPKLGAGIRQQAPRHPGIYGMLDPRGNLIYVGKAKCLRSRLMSYFRVRSRDPKAGRIIDHTRSIVWEHAPSEFAALIRELELIQRYRPRYNVQGQPGSRRYNYVCLGRAPAPYAYVTREPTGKETAWFGPVVGGARAKEAVRRLNDWYRLRDCSQKQKMCFSDQADLFSVDRSPGCLRFEIATCLGPCAGHCSRGEYAAQLRAARGFLEGKDAGPLAALEAAMREAAAAFQFERASALRDRLDDLRWLSDRLTWLRSARDQNSFVYPVASADGRTVWYLIHRGQVRAAMFEPTAAAARRKAARLIEAVFGPSGPLGGAPVADGQVDSVLLVAAWFRKFPSEKAAVFAHAEALRRCHP